MKKRQEGGKAKCPKCQAEYDVLDDAPIKAMGGLCAACWCDWHEKNIGESRKSEDNRRATLTES